MGGQTCLLIRKALLKNLIKKFQIKACHKKGVNDELSDEDFLVEQQRELDFKVRVDGLVYPWVGLNL